MQLIPSELNVAVLSMYDGVEIFIVGAIPKLIFVLLKIFELASPRKPELIMLKAEVLIIPAVSKEKFAMFIYHPLFNKKEYHEQRNLCNIIVLF